ncbi:peptidoglycan DD-metalloendopeptidase family protein [Aliivibrio sp. S3MY1]|uniref:peptidoglycan DD-metalloendopeptidase family protein n=1 Tax=unclassified Aliivibrio TaxID=2645654 RepID=UPI002378D8AA|nr:MULTISPECIES: peptidoglycan DD-metalloendopeptidase family protein [unclassified Aliivibrio]MDD9196974.1 peptidoglycan DD-metalloendopeptidase family protein [Aliivibrio sp. S3MY1]MDD9200667.1 peptidoglycan DD-metalloendopeptidase family protein [Aliivibrio sp. S2MY1]
MLSKLTRIPVIHRILIGICSAGIVAAVATIPDSVAPDSGFYKLSVGQTYPIEIRQESLISHEQTSKNKQLSWETYTVKSGESASVLFSRVGLTARQLYNLTSSDKEIENQLTRLSPGDKLKFGFNKNQEIIQLIRPISKFETYRISKVGDSYLGLFEKQDIETQLNYTKATITSNFWNASISAGLNANQIMELAGIFGWDIDFALDIREGDSFNVLYEERYVEGEYAGKGNIIAASFTNRGDNFTAIRNDKNGNFYEPNGRAMKKAFLRSPINFRYVSSNFNPRRLHPVTGQRKAHRGTDYVAPVGTPIWAAGDGVVDKSGYNQFNGNYVFIRHSNTYITKYLHMTKRYVNAGQRVKQGDTVGTLGGTGRVTGPHLHYEFLVNGVHKDARTVSLPQSKSLTGNDKKEFELVAKERLKQLEQYSQFIVGNHPVLTHE